MEERVHLDTTPVILKLCSEAPFMLLKFLGIQELFVTVRFRFKIEKNVKYLLISIKITMLKPLSVNINNIFL